MVFRAWLVCVLLAVSLESAAPVAAAESDFPIRNGWFYTQTGGAPGAGYAITNDGGVAFWRDYQRLGGPAVLGYPASWRFVGSDGFVYQATQAALLQWRPEEDRAVLANSFDLLSNAGRDDWLRATRSVPSAIGDDGSGGDPARSREIRLSWLQDSAIRAAYLAAPSSTLARAWSAARAVELYGLPTSKPERFGPFVVQRFQRIALQRWIEPVPDMPPPNTVVPVLGGDLLKEAGLLPAQSLEPAAPGSLAARTDPGLRPVVDLLATVPVGRPLYEIARREHLAFVWAPMPAEVGAMFSARRGWIAVNLRWRDGDPRALAALVSHELSHARDYLAERPLWTTSGCFETEENAYRVQGSVWESFYGPNGKSAAELNDLERQQNYVLALGRDRAALSQRIAEAYRSECERLAG